MVIPHGQWLARGMFPLDSKVVSTEPLGAWLSIGGAACWVVCFWWMHSISAKQNRLLKQLAEQGARIEQLSKAEHDLIREVHPQVAEIKEGVDEVKTAVTESGPASLPGAKHANF